MTTTSQAHGGGAKPASITTSGVIAGGAALRVYGFDSATDAVAAGFVCEGGPALPVALITDAQINSGVWRLEGDPSAMVVYTAPAGVPVAGGYAVPVYPVNGWGIAPVPVPPLFVSAEVGTVGATTVAITFDQDVSASDYAAGVTIKVNGSGATINTTARQINHAIVYYVLSAAVINGDTVTWEYAEASGNIVAEDDSVPLGDVTAQSVTNNVAPAGPVPLLDLEADTLVLSDSDPVSLWSDQSGNGYNFTQTGDARPTYHTGGGTPYIEFDGINDTMIGSDFADNLASFTVVAVVKEITNNGALITKLDVNGDWLYAGWSATFSITIETLWKIIFNLNDPLDESATSFTITTLNFSPIEFVGTWEKISNSEIGIYLNGVASEEAMQGTPVTGFSNSESVRIGSEGGVNGIEDAGYAAMKLYAVRIYSPALDATDRAAVEAELAARYGITL